MGESTLGGKKILIVDDEPDILESLEEILFMCTVVTAKSFQEAKEHLETQDFDIAVLDIMGVDGYGLLEIANRKKIATVMLTAHAMTPYHMIKSYKEGAASFIPKDMMAHLPTFLEDILEAQAKGKNFWWRWLDRLASYMDYLHPELGRPLDPKGQVKNGEVH